VRWRHSNVTLRDDTPTLIVADHGIYAWGKDLRQARWHLELTEALLRIALANL
jgi:methylthioribulose-1-phosphate dehydratase